MRTVLRANRVVTGGESLDAELSQAEKPVFVVRADEQGLLNRAFFRELRHYKEAFWVLVWRIVLVRYKQTVVGMLWVLLRPVILMLILTLVFSLIAELDQSSHTPYPLVVLAAIIFWQFFSNVLIESGNSLVANAGIISKVYFPRLLFPASVLMAGLIDFVLTLSLFIPLMLWYGYYPDFRIVFFPLFAFVGVMLAFGIGLWLSALNVRYRDFQVLAPFMVQIGFFLSPVGYRSANIPDNWQWLYDLNPMVGVIEGIRWSLLAGDSALRTEALVASGVAAIVVFLTGLRYFRRAERYFADVI